MCLYGNAFSQLVVSVWRTEAKSVSVSIDFHWSLLTKKFISHQYLFSAFTWHPVCWSRCSSCGLLTKKFISRQYLFPAFTGHRVSCGTKWQATKRWSRQWRTWESSFLSIECHKINQPNRGGDTRNALVGRSQTRDTSKIWQAAKKQSLATATEVLWGFQLSCSSQRWFRWRCREIPVEVAKRNFGLRMLWLREEHAP